MRFFIGLALFIMPFLLVALLMGTWPTFDTGGQNLRPSWVLERALGTNLEVRLLFIVALAGAVGSSIQAAKSFAAHLGARDFDDSWIAWYFLRFPVGVGLGLLTYLIVRGGFLTGSFSQEAQVAKSINPFGITAVAALTGMFAKEASDKLAEVFANLFSTQEAAKGGAPTITGATVVKDVSAATDTWLATVKGTNFVTGATLLVGGTEITPTTVKSTELEATLGPTEVGVAKTLKLKVKNPSGKTSADHVAKVT